MTQAVYTDSCVLVPSNTWSNVNARSPCRASPAFPSTTCGCPETVARHGSPPASGGSGRTRRATRTEVLSGEDKHSRETASGARDALSGEATPSGMVARQTATFKKCKRPSWTIRTVHSHHNHSQG